MFLKVLRAVKPDKLVIIGDFCDFYAVSSFPKDPDRKASLEWELDICNEALDELRGDHETIYCEGNHESRLSRFLTEKAPAIHGLLSTRSALRLKERGISWVPYKQSIKIGKFHFTHDIGRSGVNAGRQSVVDFGGNIVFGHTHQGGTSYSGTVRGEAHVALNVGWLGDYGAIDYRHADMAKRQWRHGFGLVRILPNGNGWANFVPIIGGQCVVDGKVFT